MSIELDLCHGSIYGASFIRDRGPTSIFERSSGRIPGNYFTCASEANGVNIFPCTGSEHRHGVEYVCTCRCHGPVPWQPPSTAAWWNRAIAALHDLPAPTHDRAVERWHRG